MISLRSFATLVLAFGLMILPVSSAWADSIKVTVNEIPITDSQISQRSKLVKLEGRGSNDSARLTMAREELIDEVLKLEEAARLGISVTNQDVDDALIEIARGMRISTDNLNLALQRSGANPDTLRERLKAQIAWNRIKQIVIASRVQFSEAELEQRAESQLTPEDGWDYILKEIRFIIPRGSNVSQQRRTADANQYRASFNGCSSAVELSMSYTDAAVIDVGRRHATQLPDQISAELAKLNVGGITTPRVVENGVTLLAICEKTSARDVTFVANQLRQEVGAELLNAESEKYLQDLRDNASIVNR